MLRQSARATAARHHGAHGGIAKKTAHREGIGGVFNESDALWRMARKSGYQQHDRRAAAAAPGARAAK